ncbi:MAG: lamin tail domain-containing protein [Saprospiraceae bacterium]|nr:lamin tail domain-containing protein [Saprospiraceae bacterium]
MGNSMQTITWNVAGTTAAPVNCANVDILLTTNGGMTFTTLLAATPNDGSQSATIPNIATTTARIWIRCSDNIFYDVSNVNFSIVPTPCTELYFSEYVEGTSNNKVIEIYNPTNATVTLTGNYQIKIYFNGSASAGSTINLTGTIAPCGVFVISNNLAAPGILAIANQTSSSLNFNGDDAVELFRNATSTTLDVIGQIGFDPGTEWGSGLTSTMDNTLQRKTSIGTGDNNGTDAFVPATEWDGFATDDFTGLGAYVSVACAQPPAIVCPTAPALLNEAGAVCSGGGTSTFTTWQSNRVAAVAGAGGTGVMNTIEYSTSVPSSTNPATGATNITGTIPAGCAAVTQAVTAYMRCDNGTPNNLADDIWTAIGTYTLTVYPAVRTPNIFTGGCSVIVTGIFSCDVVTLRAIQQPVS